MNNNRNQTSTLNRRSFLTRSAGAGAVAAAAGAVSLASGKLAFATPNNPSLGDAVVTIFLRGGMDGLSLVPPHGYASYRRLRPTIAVPPPGGANGALALSAQSSPSAKFSAGFEGGVVGLHPQMRPLYDSVWRDGTLAVIPGVGTDENTTRSHFSAMSVWERGSASGSVQTGFLDRLLTLQGSGTGMSGMSKSKALSASLRGPSASVTVDEVSRFGVTGFRRRQFAVQALDSLYDGSGMVEAVGGRVFELAGQLEPMAAAASNLGSYPDTDLGHDLRDVAVLLGSSAGLRATSIDFGGWDTHSNQGGPGSGRFASQVGELAAALRAFTDDLKSTGAYAETTILVITEFGRTINENGSGGTDHGRATSIMMMGGGVQGGVFGYDYYDQIADDPRYGDLTVLTDWRDPISQLLSARTGVDPTALFPTLSPKGALGLSR